MFRHIGTRRNFIHNLRLAVLLCFTAGFVNACGFLAFATLTTNVTGHAAILAVKITEADLTGVLVILVWLLLFLTGAFLSSFYIHKVGRDKVYAYTLPMMVEILILLAVALWGHNYGNTIIKHELFPGSLLFAMGVQNAMVSMVSGSVVRTTHLTGIFTDLGIDLSVLAQTAAGTAGELKKRIYLRVMIIVFFLVGGIAGGFLYHALKNTAFLIPAGVLVITIVYDYFRVRWRRKWLHAMRRKNQ